MSDYTPTTEDVRRQYRAPAASVDLTDPQRDGEDFADYLSRAAGVDAFRHQQASYLTFDRWLAAHDREVAARALDEAADIAKQYAEEARQYRDSETDYPDSRNGHQWHGMTHGANDVAIRIARRADSLRAEGSAG